MRGQIRTCRLAGRSVRLNFNFSTPLFLISYASRLFSLQLRRTVSVNGYHPPMHFHYVPLAFLRAMVSIPTLSVLTFSMLPSQGVAMDPHVEAVVRTVEDAGGRVERTADGLSLTLVDLSVPGAGPHERREVDPFDAAFFAHLGRIDSLESLTIIGTKCNDDWMLHLAGLTKLKSLKLINNGQLTDAGMEHLAGLKNLEQFVFAGTRMTGIAYDRFDGFTKLVRVSHRGSNIDDAGLRAICDHLPKVEQLSLAHAKFTDAGATHLAKLSKLKGLEIGSRNATPSFLAALKHAPLEYLQLGDGLASALGITACRELTSLTKLTLTHCASLDDEGLQLLATLRQLKTVEIDGLDLPDPRIEQLRGLSFLQDLRLIPRPHPYSPMTKARVTALLPTVKVRFR